MRKPELDNEEDDFDDAQAGPSAAQSNLTSSQRDLQGKPTVKVMNNENNIYIYKRYSN